MTKESQMTKPKRIIRRFPASSFFRHSSFVIRHLQCASGYKTRLLEFSWINRHMLDPLSVPGVDHMG